MQLTCPKATHPPSHTMQSKAKDIISWTAPTITVTLAHIPYNVHTHSYHSYLFYTSHVYLSIYIAIHPQPHPKITKTCPKVGLLHPH